jgi:hypothetical protein
MEIKCAKCIKLELKKEATASLVFMVILLWLGAAWCIERSWLLVNVSVVL